MKAPCRECGEGASCALIRREFGAPGKPTVYLYCQNDHVHDGFCVPMAFVEEVDEFSGEASIDGEVMEIG